MENSGYMNVINLDGIPSFHDAELTKIEHHPDGRELQLQFRRVGGEIGTFRFCGVVSQRMVDFAEQNVVSRLLISPAYKFSAAEVGQWLGWVDGRVDSKVRAIDPTKAALLAADLQDGRHALFILEPSCGAEVAVLCEQISLSVGGA
ncbi:hypothetical protein WL30_11070 [Burkholderia ubonensis]|uniref:hypothetical protein n=1 Tax=Burkholderia ubonensis TaxID=101571 RepID=UPI00075C7536|nr:hypothetical protein [Burkholderia ubonensis]KWA73017.1 hypothetical protein WL30_11070 [Burkholderia ubonensis]KWB18339.1 hypothetical protein WL31_11290 [Burkholderia ubonensis]